MMDWSDLGNPCPRSEPRHYRPILWPDGERIPLGTIATNSTEGQTYIELVGQRRTRREFAPITLDQLGSLLWVTCRVQDIGGADLGFPLSRRPCPSAGAIHPIHVLLIRPGDSYWYRYDPFAHLLQVVPSQIDVRTVVGAFHDVFAAPDATLMLLAAEPGMTAAKYESPASLIWRDAGVLLGFLAMVAHSLDLSFCPLGITGEPWVSQLVDQSGLAGVGTAYVGSAHRH